MAFTPPGARTPTAIVSLSIVLTDRLAIGDDPASQLAHYSLGLVDQNGEQMHFPADTGSLAPHLTSQEIQQLQAFMASLRERAETQILGG